MRRDIDVIFMVDLIRAMVVILMICAAAFWYAAAFTPIESDVRLWEKAHDAMLVFSDDERIGTGEILILLTEDTRFEPPYAEMRSGDVLRIALTGKSEGEWVADQVIRMCRGDE